MEPLTLKLICIPIILTLNALFGGIPFALISRRQRIGIGAQQSPKLTRILSLASCFSAGVFLATCFVGLFPSVELKFQRVMRSLGRTMTYPVPEVTVCAGFFAVWLLEQLLHKCVRGLCSGSEAGRIENHTTNDHRHTSPRHQRNSEININGHGDTQHSLLQHEEHEISEYDEEEEHHYPENFTTNTQSVSGHHGHSHMPVGGDSTLRSVLLTFALGSHSILEGLGFGLLDKLSQVLNMALAIVIHECLCALSLGLQLGNQRTRPCLAYILIGTFSILIPVGIGIGLSLVASETGVTGQIVTLVLQGMAAGTFIYVVFFEILPPEISVSRDPIIKVLCTAFGFVTIALIRLITIKE